MFLYGSHYSHLSVSNYYTYKTLTNDLLNEEGCYSASEEKDSIALISFWKTWNETGSLTKCQRKKINISIEFWKYSANIF